MEEFGWLFRRHHQELDFGVDGQIEVVTLEGLVTGQMLGCQIKCGKSFFRESNRWGYIYRGGTKHLNYLANYPVPVIIVICDPDSQEAYWARFHVNDVEVTEAGWKLTIPYGNKLASSKAALEALLPPPKDHLPALREYWNINRLMVDAAIIVYMVVREEVERADIRRAQHFFKRLRATRELAYHCREKVEIGFYGYDDDERELFEIEEVRQYVASLDEAFPELFFFGRTELPNAVLRLFLFCVSEISWEGGERSTPLVSRRVIVEPTALPDFLLRHFQSLNEMAEWCGLGEDEIYRISMAVSRRLGFDYPEG